MRMDRHEKQQPHALSGGQSSDDSHSVDDSDKTPGTRSTPDLSRIHKDLCIRKTWALGLSYYDSNTAGETKLQKELTPCIFKAKLSHTYFRKYADCCAQILSPLILIYNMYITCFVNLFLSVNSSLFFEFFVCLCLSDRKEEVPFSSQNWLQ